MFKNKFEDFLAIVELILEDEGFKKSRKKGEYYKETQEKIIKLRFVMNKVRGRSEVREIRSFISLEYPEVEKIVAQLKQEKYKKGNTFFSFDIDLFRGKNSYRSFYFFGDSNMKLIAENIGEILKKKVFPILKKYEKDEYLLEIFSGGGDKRSFQYGKLDIDYYLKWISLCIKNNLIKEAFSIIDIVSSYYEFSEKLSKTKLLLEKICENKIQEASCHVITSDKKILFNPLKEQIIELVLELDSVQFYYFILSNSLTDDYLQVGGGNGEYTLEIRLHEKENYKHYKAGLRNYDNFERKIIFGNGFLELKNNQVLSIYQIKDIISKFLENKSLHKNYEWTEMKFE